MKYLIPFLFLFVTACSDEPDTYSTRESLTQYVDEELIPFVQDIQTNAVDYASQRLYINIRIKFSDLTEAGPGGEGIHAQCEPGLIEIDYFTFVQLMGQDNGNNILEALILREVGDCILGRERFSSGFMPGTDPSDDIPSSLMDVQDYRLTNFNDDNKGYFYRELFNYGQQQ